MDRLITYIVFLCRQFPRRHLVATLALAGCIAVVTLVVPGTGNSVPNSPSVVVLSLPEPAERNSEGVEEEVAPQREWQEITVRGGDTLAGLLRARGVAPAAVHELVTAHDELKRLARIKPGDILRIEQDETNRLTAIQYQPSRIEILNAEYGDGGWQVVAEVREYERRVRYAEGMIDGSLFLAGQQAGMSDALIMELANIFGWDIDFVLDIRKGDGFRVLYEELLLDGEKIGDGNILMAEFENQGRTVTALRYETRNGDADYFDVKGDSMRKEFIRTPVAFTRISSRFSNGRYHPVLHKVRAHKGIDYAAPRGTPVKSAGDGKVVFAGNKGGYGRVIIIQHGQRYRTLYAHLNGYARGIRSGQRVRQGQTIGYVGASGLATGPHLHYEFQVNGVHRDPLTVPLPKARGLADNERKDFLVHASRLRNQLALHAEASTLARADTP